MIKIVKIYKLCCPVPKYHFVLVGAQASPPPHPFAAPALCSLALITPAATTAGCLEWRWGSERVLVGNKCLGQGKRKGQREHIFFSFLPASGLLSILSGQHTHPRFEEKLVIAVVHLEPRILNETN